jgi:hypothetical protein
MILKLYWPSTVMMESGDELNIRGDNLEEMVGVYLDRAEGHSEVGMGVAVGSPLTMIPSRVT